MILAVLAFALQPDPGALLRLYEQAAAERRRQWGEAHAKTARGEADLGLYLRKLGRMQDAADHLGRALAIDEKLYAADHPQIIEDMENLASVLSGDSAAALYRRAARSRDPATAARNLAKLASLDAKNAITLYRQALAQEETASGAEHPAVAIRLNDLALAVEPADAEPLLRRAAAIQQKLLGETHPETATTLNNLAGVLLARRNLPEAESLQRRALAALENTLGPEHPRVATACSNLADVLRARGRRKPAETLYRRALEIDERFYGSDHPEVAADLRNLAGLLGKTSEASRLLRRAESIERAQ